jgi:branched-chain amino acid transport system ATP-binding protein
MLNVEDLTVRYQALTALSVVSLGVEEGTLVALIGSNGAGKTTLLNTLSGLVPAVEGRILWQGQSIGGLSPDEISQLGIIQVPEGRKLFAGMTVAENLDMGCYLPGPRSKAAENRKRVFELFPILADRHHQVAGSLSGGEQQMLALGRALMACPRLLMLDEPSLGLAPIVATEIFRILDKLNQDGLTILLVSQEVLQTLTIAKHAYLLENGRIALSGSSDGMLADPRVKESYLGL